MTEFKKWPHADMAEEKDAHLRLVAIIGVTPFRTVVTNGLYEYWFPSMRAGVEYVKVAATPFRWVYTRVVRDGQPMLEWRSDEDIPKTARWWSGDDTPPEYSLIRDMSIGVQDG